MVIIIMIVLLHAAAAEARAALAARQRMRPCFPSSRVLSADIEGGRWDCVLLGLIWGDHTQRVHWSCMCCDRVLRTCDIRRQWRDDTSRLHG